MDLKARAQALKTDLPAIFLALKSPDTPPAAKVLAALTAAYALSPVDLIPDFIPVLGYLDDVLVLPGLIALTVRLIPPAVLERCRAEAAAHWAGGGRRWYFALPVAAVWLLLGWLLARALLG